MSSITLLLAWRYLRACRQQKNIALMINICFIALVIGSFALALVLAIMEGFEQATYTTLQTIHPTLMIQSSQPLNIKKIGALLHKEFPDIISFSPSSMQHGILKQQDSNDISHVVAIKGIVPESEAQTTALERTLIEPTSSKTLSSLLLNNHIIIGHKLADSLGAHLGDTLELLYLPEQEEATEQFALQKESVIVAGIFKTGVEEFDYDVVISSLEFLHTLFPQAGTTTIGIKIEPTANITTLKQALSKRFHLNVCSWKDLYPALVAALSLEKYASFIIVSLIVLVASMSIMSLLFMLITYKRADIAIFKAMGMSQKTIRHIFLLIGTFIALFGSLTGLVLAWCVGWLLKTYQIIPLPDIYYVSHVPISLHLSLFLIVFAVVMMLSLCATWLALGRTEEINIAHILRFEA